MNELLLWIENSMLGTFVRESVSLWAYPGMLALHTIGLGFVVGASAAVALRLLGAAREIPLSALEKFYPVIFIGFWVNTLSGIALTTVTASTILKNPLFLAKLALIAAAVVCMATIRKRVLSSETVVRTGVVPPLGRRLAWLSLVCWLGAIITGRAIAYVLLLAETFGI